MSVTRASQKKAMLLHYVGEETCDVYETLTVPEPTEGTDEYQTSIKALTDYFEPQKCVDHHVYVFRQATQKSGENITEFYTRLQLLTRKCEFATIELEIKRQIIQGTSSIRLRRKAIEQNLNLENLLNAARAMETADEQTSEMDKQQSHAVGYGRIKTSDDRKKGSRDGAVVEHLPPTQASHQCGPGSIPGLGVICGLSLLLVLVLAPRAFSPGTPVFPSPQKPTFPNSNSIWIIVKHFIMSLWLSKHSPCY